QRKEGARVRRERAKSKAEEARKARASDHLPSGGARRALIGWSAAGSGSGRSPRPVKPRQQRQVLCERAEQPREPKRSERGAGAACDCEMGTEKKEVIPKEEISEEAEPHGVILEKVAKMLCQGQKLGAVCEDMLERPSGEDTEEIMEQMSAQERDFASGLIVFKKSPSEKDQGDNGSESICSPSPNLQEGGSTAEALLLLLTDLMSGSSRADCAASRHLASGHSGEPVHLTDKGPSLATDLSSHALDPLLGALADRPGWSLSSACACTFINHVLNAYDCLRPVLGVEAKRQETAGDLNDLVVSAAEQRRKGWGAPISRRSIGACLSSSSELGRRKAA
ncbi:hypothetical protein MC885_015765, partial [Smutsia gigantea]